MGLTIISMEGMRIKQLRTYALKCKSCCKWVHALDCVDPPKEWEDLWWFAVSLCSYRITTKITEMFCPHCGYKTLIKVAMVVGGEEGSIHYQPLSQKQFSHRGLRVSCHSVVCKNWSSFYHVSSISTILILRLFVAPGISIFGYYLVNTGAAKACPQALANRACVWGYHLPCIV